MEPAFLKVIANKEVARRGQGRQRRKRSQFTCDTCPRPVLAAESRDPSGEPLRAPAPRPQPPPELPHPRPTLPPPRRQAPRASRGPTLPGLPRKWFSGARAVAWGGPSWPSLSSITPRRLRGLPAPGNRGETRPGCRPRPLSASSDTPRRPAFGTPHPALLPARRPPRPGARAAGRRAQGSSAKGPWPPLTCRRSFSATGTRSLPGAWTHRLRGLGALGGARRGAGSRGRRRRGPLCACAASGLGLGGRRAQRG